MKALICGISGQDGAYLADFLLRKGYEVYGTSRDANISPFANLIRLGIRNDVTTLSMAPTDFRSVLSAISESEPDEIYNLSGQSSVALSFEQPVDTLESISVATLNMLESIRFLKKPIKLYNASSSECFGDIGSKAADENTSFRPRSPYAVAKSAAFWECANYREAYDLFVCNGILFNHESPLRPKRFVTRKIIHSAVMISRGLQDTLKLGNLNIERDWGWAPEYVEAMWLMLKQDKPDDFIIATGCSHTLQEFVNETFKQLKLDWQDHVIFDKTITRPTDLSVSKANPSKSRDILGWQARFQMKNVIQEMIKAELEN